MLIFFIVGRCTAMGYFQSWIDYNKLPPNFISRIISLLVEQCVADSISDGSESEEVAD